MSIRQQKLPIAVLERIDDRCANFEKRWQSGDPPSVESVLAGEVVAIERDALLAELIVLEIDYRRRRGETPTEKEYLDRFPNDVDVIEDALNDGSKKTGAFKPPTIARLSDLFPALQVIELVGVGGMGAVYKARQEGLDRVVAVKVLPEEFGHDVKFALRFTREARTLARLNHPSIVSVYEFGQVDETYYFLMEYVEGSTLREVVTTGRLTPSEALAIVPHLCDSLQYAHDQGVIHRDIKPENILMSVDGSVKIADFGLSRLLNSESKEQVLTATHQVMGTPRYMAPEQFEGSHGVDHRADIYSLGVVIYEMLTGELPLGRFAAPSTKVEIDVRLDEVVLRTLEKEPHRRYQQARQIKSDVQSITSSDRLELAPTVDLDSNGREKQTGPPSLQQQELAGRLLLTRNQLMQRVKDSLRPLARWQVLQILIGVLLIGLGASCWAPNTHVPHRLISGAVVHVYGILVIASAVAVITRVKRIDFSKPVGEIRDKLDALQSVYVRVGPIMGLPWWLMWIPAAVACGFDAVVVYANSLIPSLVIGVIGLVVSVWLYVRALKSSEKWKRQFSGESIAGAHRILDEIESAQIA